MPAPGRPRARRPWLPLAAVVLAVVAVCALGFARPQTATPDPVAGGAQPAPAALVVPDDARVLIFGDSWVYGSAAASPSLGFAYVAGAALGWDTIVDGVRGSGYLKPGLDGPAYGERIAALDPALDPDLVIIEGSINDRRLPAAGYRGAVDAAWSALAQLYPAATVVVLGPAPQVLPVEKSTARIDRDLAELAAQRGWSYISPIAERWITDDNYFAVIDTSDIGRDHPSTAGHAYLAERLAQTIDRLRGTTVVAAEGPGRAM